MKNNVTKLFKIAMALVMTVFSSILVNASEENSVTFSNYYRSDRELSDRELFDRELINSFPRMIAVDAPSYIMPIVPFDAFTNTVTIVFDDLEYLLDTGLELYEIGILRLVQSGLSYMSATSFSREFLEETAIMPVMFATTSLHQEVFRGGDVLLEPMDWYDALHHNRIRINDITGLVTGFDKNGHYVLPFEQEMYITNYVIYLIGLLEELGIYVDIDSLPLDQLDDPSSDFWIENRRNNQLLIEDLLGLSQEEVDLLNKHRFENFEEETKYQMFSPSWEEHGLGGGILAINTVLQPFPTPTNQTQPLYRVISEIAWIEMPTSRRHDVFGLTRDNNTVEFPNQHGHLIATQYRERLAWRPNVTGQINTSQWLYSEISLTSNRVGHPNQGFAFPLNLPSDQIASPPPLQGGLIRQVQYFGYRALIWYNGNLSSSGITQAQQESRNHWATYLHQVSGANNFNVSVSVPLGASISVTPTTNYSEPIIHSILNHWLWWNGQWATWVNGQWVIFS